MVLHDSSEPAVVERSVFFKHESAKSKCNETVLISLEGTSECHHHHCMFISEKERALLHREIRQNIFTNDWNRFSVSLVFLLIFFCSKRSS